MPSNLSLPVRTGRKRPAAELIRWTHLTMALLKEKADRSQTGDHMPSKRFHSALMTTAIMGFVAVLVAKGAVAAEIKLIASPGVRAVVNELVPQFEKATGHKVARDFAVIVALKRRIEAGEAFDIV